MATVTRRLLGVFVALLVCGACSEVTYGTGGPPVLTITPDRTTVPLGGAVNFEFSASGAILISVVMDYGDGSKDTRDTAGAQSASGRFVHAFGTAGTFTVVGTLLDNLQGPVQAEVQIVVGGA
jgi:hypothetical protein